MADIEPRARGTHIWLFDRLRSDALTALLDDLVEKQESGIPLPTCNEISKRLQQVANRFTDVPYGGTVTRPFYEEFVRFSDTYSDWNSRKEDRSPEAIAHRRKHLEKLRKRRFKIAKRSRKLPRVMQLQDELIDAVYGSFADLARAVPQALPRLVDSIARIAAVWARYGHQ